MPETTSSATTMRPSNDDRRLLSGTTSRSRWRRIRLLQPLGGKNKYASEDEASQEEILLDLESRVNDYEGRIPSKATMQSEEDDDATHVVWPHRCGLVTILGLPNMGKSTLLNALLDDDLAIATSRPQTTRHAILGVMTTDRCQLCLTDTPGIINGPAYRLQEGMMGAVDGAVKDADVFLLVTDVESGNDDGEEDKEEGGERKDGGDVHAASMGIGEEMLDRLRNWGKPVIVCINKVDLSVPPVTDENDEDDDGNTPARAARAILKWRSLLPEAFAVLPARAIDGPNDPGVVALRSILLANDRDASDVGEAVRALGRPAPGTFANGRNMLTNEEAKGILPAGPPLYGADFFTDRTDRFCASELIRETLFERARKELPYCCEVRVEAFDESERDDARRPMIRMGAVILVERDTQKGIVVGKGGSMIKDIGVEARRKLEEFFGVKVFLDLRVKVDKNWRNNEDKLKKFGYMK